MKLKLNMKNRVRIFFCILLFFSRLKHNTALIIHNTYLEVPSQRDGGGLLQKMEDGFSEMERNLKSANSFQESPQSLYIRKSSINVFSAKNL